MTGARRPGQDADVIVVGAGHNGLVAACYLARAGLDVLVLECRDEIGGCTTSKALLPEAPGHVFNQCANDVITMRGSTVARDLQLSRHGYREVSVEPPYVALAPDGSSLAFWRDVRRTVAEIEHFSRRDARAYEGFMEQLLPVADAAIPMMATSATRPEPGRVLRAARLVGHPRSLGLVADLATSNGAQAVAYRFEHPIVQAGLGQLAAYGSPITMDSTGLGLLSVGVIMRVGMGRARGGTGMLPLALQRCLTAARGRVRTSARVDRLLIGDDGTVHGVRLDTGDELRAATVLTATEPTQVLTKWLPRGVLPRKLAGRAANIPTKSANCAHFKASVALRGRLQLTRHTAARRDDLDLRISSTLVGTLEEIVRGHHDAGAGRLPDPLPFTGFLNTGADPSLAPEGQDGLQLWTGWVPIAPIEGWESLKEIAGKALIDHAMQYYDGIESLEIGHFFESPPEMIERTGIPDGNILQVDMTLGNLGPMRPVRGLGGYRTPVAGLYLSGAGTHPGPSVSGLPGQQAARTVLRDLARKK